MAVRYSTISTMKRLEVRSAQKVQIDPRRANVRRYSIGQGSISEKKMRAVRCWRFPDAEFAVGQNPIKLLQWFFFKTVFCHLFITSRVVDLYLYQVLSLRPYVFFCLFFFCVKMILWIYYYSRLIGEGSRFFFFGMTVKQDRCHQDASPHRTVDSR